MIEKIIEQEFNDYETTNEDRLYNTGFSNAMGQLLSHDEEEEEEQTSVDPLGGLSMMEDDDDDEESEQQQGIARELAVMDFTAMDESQIAGLKKKSVTLLVFRKGRSILAGCKERKECFIYYTYALAMFIACRQQGGGGGSSSNNNS
jgi:hypothetical protein